MCSIVQAIESDDFQTGLADHPESWCQSGRGSFLDRIKNGTLLFRFGFFGPFETDDQGNRQGKFFGRLDDAFGDVVTTHDAAKDVNKDALHFRIREKDLERLLDRLGRGTPDKPKTKTGANAT